MNFELSAESHIHGVPTLAVVGLAAIGAYSVAKSTLNLLGSIKRHYFRGQYPMYFRYARVDSWAVVTGGSDGIGYEICNNLAKQGFNICMIARN